MVSISHHDVSKAPSSYLCFCWRVHCRVKPYKFFWKIVFTRVCVAQMTKRIQFFLFIWLQLEHWGIRTFLGSLPVWAKLELVGLLRIWVVELLIRFLGLHPLKKLGHNLPLEDMLDLIVRTLQTPRFLSCSCESQGVASCGIREIVKLCCSRL